MSEYLLSVWRTPGLHASGAACQSDDETQTPCARVSCARGHRVKLRHLAG